MSICGDLITKAYWYKLNNYVRIGALYIYYYYHYSYPGKDDTEIENIILYKMPSHNTYRNHIPTLGLLQNKCNHSYNYI